jgi:uncharacterized membrane protein YkoI
MRQNKRVIIIIFLGIIAIITGIFLQTSSFASQMSASEAEEKVEQLYTGKVVTTLERDDRFLITLSLSGGEYELVLDRKSGDILSMTKTKSSPNNNSDTTTEEGVEAGKEEPSEPTPSNEEPTSQITEQKAIGIALEKMAGTVEEVELEESNGVSYYLVEIEANDQQEATIQVHSITGEVISITWDD